jgi:catechol 2,3-dioxygenase-like lactoylglutathione lyase family enzyme
MKRLAKRMQTTAAMRRCGLIASWCATMSVLSAVSTAGAVESKSNEPSAEHGHFHHVHVNVSDVQKTSAFYEKVFSAVPITYGNRQLALLTDRSFIFLNQVAAPIKSQLQTGVIHIGWSGIDGKSEYAWWQKEGIEFYTPLTAFGPGEFMYLYGPDREVVEIWTNERHRRLNHVHMLATDPKETAEWFARVVNPDSKAELVRDALGNYNVKVDNVTLHTFPDNQLFKPKERDGEIQHTDGSGIDHLAFSFRNLNAAYQRLKALGIPIEKPIATEKLYGVESFFVRAPNGVLVELIKAKPLPEAAWE